MTEMPEYADRKRMRAARSAAWPRRLNHGYCFGAKSMRERSNSIRLQRHHPIGGLERSYGEPTTRDVGIEIGSG